MRSIMKRLALWHIVLIIGIAVVAIPVAARVSGPAQAGVNEQDKYLGHQNGNHHDDAVARESKDKKDPKVRKGDPAARPGIKRPQDDYYQRRRQHWERRLDNRLDDEEIGDDNDDDFAADDSDRQQDVYERRREYFRDRLDEDW